MYVSLFTGASTACCGSLLASRASPLWRYTCTNTDTHTPQWTHTHVSEHTRVSEPVRNTSVAPSCLQLRAFSTRSWTHSPASCCSSALHEHTTDTLWWRHVLPRLLGRRLRPLQEVRRPSRMYSDIWILRADALPADSSVFQLWRKENDLNINK